MANKVSNLSEILSEALDVGINFRTLSREIGVPKSTLSDWKGGKYCPENSDDIIRAIKRKSKFLKSLKVNNAKDLDQVELEIGLKEAKLAEILGISRQALNFQKQNGFADSRLKEIQAILRGLGSHLGDIIEKYS